MRKVMAVLAAVVVLAVAGCTASGSTGGNSHGGNSGNGAAFQGDPALDGLKPGDCLKYPSLDACK